MKSIPKDSTAASKTVTGTKAAPSASKYTKLTSGTAKYTKLTSNAALKKSTSSLASGSKGAAPTGGKKAEKKRSFLDDDEASGFFIRGAPLGLPEKPDDGKVVIPKILLESGRDQHPDEGIGRVTNANAYESIGKISPPDKQKKEKDDRRLKNKDGHRGKIDTAVPNRSLYTRHSATDSQRSMIGTDAKEKKAEKKGQRKFIRSLLRNDEYGEPACCPRVGVLIFMWIVVISILIAVFKFGLKMEEIVPEPSIAFFDKDSKFGRVMLYE